MNPARLRRNPRPAWICGGCSTPSVTSQAKQAELLAYLAEDEDPDASSGTRLGGSSRRWDLPVPNGLS